MAVYLHIRVLPPAPKSLPRKNEKTPTAEKLPPYGVTSEILPPYFGFTASAEVVTAKKRKTAYHQKNITVLHYRPKSTAICDIAYKSTPMYMYYVCMAITYIIQSWSGVAEQGKEIFPCPRTCLRIGSREAGSAVSSRVSLLILHTQAESGAYLRDSSRVPRRRPFIYVKPPYAIWSVPNLSGHAIAYRWRSLPKVRRHKASKPQGSSERVLPWQVTMDQ